MTLLRSDQALVTVRVEGVALDSEPWQAFEDGNVKVQGLKIFPGGQKPMINLGGVPDRDDAKVARTWSIELAGLKKQLDAVAGEAAMEIYVTPLIKGVPTGTTETYSGVLGNVERAKYKSGPATEEFLTLTLMPHGTVQ